MAKKYKELSIAELKAERDKLWISGKDPERLNELISKILYLEYGIVER